MPEPRARHDTKSGWRAVAFITASIAVHLCLWMLAPRTRLDQPTPPKEKFDVKIVETERPKAKPPTPKKPRLTEEEKKVPPPIKRQPKETIVPPMKAFEPNASP